MAKTEAENEKRQKIFIEDLIGSPIITAQGKRLGHIVDLEVSSKPPHYVTYFYFGRYAWLYRFDVLNPFIKAFGIEPAPKKMPWTAVDRFEQLKLFLKPDAPLPDLRDK